MSLEYKQTNTPSLIIVESKDRGNLGTIMFNGFKKWVFISNNLPLSRLELRGIYNKLNRLEKKDKEKEASKEISSND